MSEHVASELPHSREIGLLDLVLVLWRSKWILFIGTLVCAILCVLLALSLPNVYRSSALLVPNENRSADGIGTLPGQYGALASLAGINLGQSSGGNIQTGLAILTSKQFVYDFIDRHELLVPLMAAEGWDAASNELVIDPDVYDVGKERWTRDVKPPKQPKPSAQEAYEAFSEAMRVSENPDNGLISISVESLSPALAKQWVDWLVRDLNDSVMRRDVDRAEKTVGYLNAQLESTAVSELRAVLFRLIEEQTRILMLAQVSDEYLLRTLDPAVVPEKKIRPVRSLIVLLGTFIGFVLIAIGVLVHGLIFRSD